MVIESKEEVYAWFKDLSGAKRIEVLSGLLNNCIPLEWRFFASLIESLAKRDYQNFLEDESRTNNPHQMQSLCEKDWLQGVYPIVIPQPVQQPMAVGQSLVLSSPAQVLRNGEPMMVDVLDCHPQVVEASTSVSSTSSSDFSTSKTSLHHINPNNAVNAIPATSTTPVVMFPTEIPIRSKVVISLCLLYSTNRVCATIVFKAFHKHLSLEAIQSRLEPQTITFGSTGPVVASTVDSSSNINNNNNHVKTPNKTAAHVVVNPLVVSNAMNPGMYLDAHFVAEVTLLYTLALYHPAFSYEQKSYLSDQLLKLNAYLDFLRSRVAPNTHSFFYGPTQVTGSTHGSTGSTSSSQSTPSSHQTFSPPAVNMPGILPVHHHHQHHQQHISFLAYQSQHNSVYPPNEVLSGDLKPAKGVPKTCYNCGQRGHRGNECTEETFDDVTKDTDFNLNFHVPMEEHLRNGMYTIPSVVAPSAMHSPATVVPKTVPSVSAVIVPHLQTVNQVTPVVTTTAMPTTMSTPSQLRRPSADKMRLNSLENKLHHQSMSSSASSSNNDQDINSTMIGKNSSSSQSSSSSSTTSSVSEEKTATSTS